MAGYEVGEKDLMIVKAVEVYQLIVPRVRIAKSGRVLRAIPPEHWLEAWQPGGKDAARRALSS
jgi:hypothetical protein